MDSVIDVDKINVYRVLLMNFLSSLIIAIVTCDIFDAFSLNGGMYLGNLFGLYFLVVYGVNNLADAREIPDNGFRFVLILILTVIFDVIFIFMIPLLFGPDAFPATEFININYNGVPFALKLSREFYLVLFAVIMLIFNFIIYRREDQIVYDEN